MGPLGVQSWVSQSEGAGQVTIPPSYLHISMCGYFEGFGGCAAIYGRCCSKKSFKGGGNNPSDKVPTKHLKYSVYNPLWFDRGKVAVVDKIPIIPMRKLSQPSLPNINNSLLKKMFLIGYSNDPS